MSEPGFQYTGGQPDVEPARRWPYVVFGAVVLVLLAAGVLLWGPASAASRRAVGELLPDSLAVNAGLSSQDAVVGGPLNLVIQVDDAGIHSINGITLRLRNLSQRFELISAEPNGKIDGETIYFGDTLSLRNTETLTIKLIPKVSGRASLVLSFSAGHSSQSLTLGTSAGSPVVAERIQVVVREPRPGDLDAELGVHFDAQVQAGSQTLWGVAIHNIGALRITDITLRFPNLPPSFEVTTTNPRATTRDNGRTVRFDTTILDPGDVALLQVGAVPHASGSYHIAWQMFVLGITQSFATGQFDVTVAPAS